MVMELTPEQIQRQEETRRNLAAIVAHRETIQPVVKSEVESGPILPDSTPQIEHEPSTCRTCGKSFTAAAVQILGQRIVAMNCEPCVKAWNGSNQPKADARETAWNAICPSEYRNTDEARVRQEVGSATVDRVLAWPHTKGLCLAGKVGRCKTRLMFMLMRKFHFAGHRVRYVNAANMADDLSASYGDRRDPEAYMRGIERAPILFIDDLGKGKLTERLDEFLYRMSEHRSANQLPTFFTTNMKGDDIQKAWDEIARVNGFWADRAAATVRRLKMNSEAIGIK